MGPKLGFTKLVIAAIVAVAAAPTASAALGWDLTFNAACEHVVELNWLYPSASFATEACFDGPSNQNGLAGRWTLAGTGTSLSGFVGAMTSDAMTETAWWATGWYSCDYSSGYSLTLGSASCTGDGYWYRSGDRITYSARLTAPGPASQVALEQEF